MSGAGGEHSTPADQIRALEAEVIKWDEVLGRIDPASPTAQADFENARVARGLARLRLVDFQQRARGDPARTLDSYLETDQVNLDRIRVLLPHFRVLMPSIHDLYELSRLLIPADSSRVFGYSLLLCHKSFLAAAGTIARRHPDDAAAITRRAIEVISLALAIHADPQNLERWRATDSRISRWDARLQGQRPPRLESERIRYPKHPVLEELRRYLGILSDAFVHFTPEFVAGQPWRQETRGERLAVELPFLEVNQAVIERELLVLGATHHRILKLFDEIYGGTFSRDERWAELEAQAVARGAALGSLFREPPAASGTADERPTT
jgi:hypothetical protein